MAFIPDTRAYPGAPAASQSALLDAGLRSYMLRVYNWMASGLVLTGIVAYGIVNVPALFDAFYPLVQTPYGLRHAPGALAYISMFAPLAFTMVLSFGINKLSTTAAQALYWAFCVAMGASLTTIFLVYTGQSIVQVFFIAAGTFAATSIYGYTTRRDLTSIGGFCMMGLFGIIIAMLANMFIQSSGMGLVVSIIGVLVFVGLTAFDTQRIKSDYVNFTSSYGPDMAAKRSVIDSLGMLLNFINIFMFMLRIFGNRNN